jgi:hypothetical protein
MASSPDILLSDDVLKCRESFHPKLTCTQFEKCVDSALKEEFPDYRKARGSRCGCVLKVAWLCWLGFLAFCLVAVGFKPVAFYVHKV